MTRTDRASDNIRILAASMVEKSRSGHPGGAMGGADFVNVLYSEFLNYDPSNPEYIFRDRFFLDPGHMSPMLYSVLSLAGYYSMEDLAGFRAWGSITPGHPEVDLMRGVENTSGPLGQGHVMAVGAAIAERFIAARFGEWASHKTYTYISDGGIQEEISQGAGRIAGTLGLSNLIMFYDSNNIQLSTTVDQVTCEDTAAKYRAWNWNVIEICGNDADQIRTALKAANAETERPTIIIGRTIMGKGAKGSGDVSYENKVSTHGQPLSDAGADIAATIKGMGGDPENPFTLFDESKSLYAERRSKLEAWSAERQKIETEWRATNPELATKLDGFFCGKAYPEVDYSQVSVSPDGATRGASSQVLGYLGENVENMIVASADLSNSDKTDGFLKKTKAFTKGDFSGKFFQAGVAELTMAVMMNGMALHGGVIPACGTFFVFSDYMKPAVRLSALMRLHVIFIWTHDSFRVGEDGPTHQPIEQEAQIRLLEQLENHHGEASTVVLRPADAEETVAAWSCAMGEHRPVALILSRQNIKSLPTNGSRIDDAMQLYKGAYVVADCANPDVVMVANGSEVATAIAGAELLKAKGVKCRIVSAPSEGLFRSQSAEYQLSVLPEGIKRYGITSGLPITLAGLVGANGYIHGLRHFGYSAPFKVLDAKFGYTPENVEAQVLAMLK